MTSKGPSASAAGQLKKDSNKVSDHVRVVIPKSNKQNQLSRIVPIVNHVDAASPEKDNANNSSGEIRFTMHTAPDKNDSSSNILKQQSSSDLLALPISHIQGDQKDSQNRRSTPRSNITDDFSKYNTIEQQNSRKVRPYSPLKEIPNKMQRLPSSHSNQSNKSGAQRSKSAISRTVSQQSGESLNTDDQQKLDRFAQRFKETVSGKEDKEQIQKKIDEDWVDPTPDHVEGIFSVSQQNYCMRFCQKNKATKPDKIYVFDKRALYCLHFESRIRKELVAFSTSSMFENFIILLIFANSIILAIYDYEDRDNLTDFNQKLEAIGQVFTIAFTFEMILKICAQGLIFHKNAYLRDSWNWLDFVVVITGIMEMTQVSVFKVRALRTLRVLRPLRSIKAFPTMRKLVSSLVSSVNSLMNAVVFMFFIFILFGILGIQQFAGTMYRRCRFTEQPLEDGTWPYDEDLDYFCSPDGQGLMVCPEDRFCKEPGDAGLDPSIDDPFADEATMFGMFCFDNLGWALLTIFQMITLEGWTTVMYNLMDSNIWWMGIIFSVFLVIIGSFLLLNVILAVLADALTMVEEVQEKQDARRLLELQRSLDRADLQYVKRGLPPKYKNLATAQANQQMETQEDKSKIQINKLDDVNMLSSSPKHKTNNDPEYVFMKLADRTDIAAEHDKDKNDQMDSSPDPAAMSPPHPPARQGLFKQNASETKKSKQLSLFDDPQPNRVQSQTSADKKQEKQSVSSQNAIELQNLNPQPTQGDQEVAQESQSLGSYQTDKNMSNKSMVSTISMAPPRAQTNRLYYVCFRICTHWSFTLFITILIIANTIVLALEQYPEDKSTILVQNILNEFFTWAFVTEMIIKLIGLGFKEYSRDSFNLFDALVVVLSIVDIIVTEALGDGGQTGALSAFRGVRLLRVFKLARSWNSFRKILAKIIDTMKHTAIFSVLLLMFALIFSLLGMELFGYQIHFHDNQPVDKDDPNAEAPRPNFNHLGMGFTTVFAIAIGDDWNALMAQAFRNQGFIAIIFYPVVYCAMTLILLSLFLAILLEKFGTDENEENKTMDKEEKGVSKFKQRIKRAFRNCSDGTKKRCPCCFMKEDDDEEDSENESEFRSSSKIKVQVIEDNDKIKSEKEYDENPFGQSSDADSLAYDSKRSSNRDRDQPVIQQFPIIPEADPSKEAGDISEVSSSLEKNPFNRNFPDKDDGTAQQFEQDDQGYLSPLHKVDNQPGKDKRKKPVERYRSTSDMRINLSNALQKPHGVFSDEEDSQKDADKNVQNIVIIDDDDGEESQLVDMPANQQDGQVTVEQGVSKNFNNRERSQESIKPIKSSIEAVPQSDKKFQGRGKRKNFVRSQTMTKKESVKDMSKMIPIEYNPSEFYKQFRNSNKLNKSELRSFKKQKQQDMIESTQLFANTDKQMTLAQLKKLELIERIGLQKKEIKVIGKSLFIFSTENCIRRICHSIVKQSFYDTFVLILIGISTILLTMDNPNMDPKGDMANFLEIFDYVLTTLFTLECTINIILLGFFCNGKTSYARDPWNIMDLIIVFFSLFTLILSIFGGGSDLSILKVFRMLRVLRPLRFLKRNLGLKIQVISLMNSVPGVANLLIISNLILLIFSIQAVGLLKGKFFYCDMENVPDYLEDEIVTKWDCLDYGGEWINQTGNFDNVLTAMMTMFGMMSTEGWMEVMWNAVDSTEIHQVPRRDEKLGYVFFFCFFMIVGTLFILNLFVGVVINTFDREKEKLSNNNKMTDLQNEYCEVLVKCYQAKPTRAVIETGSKFRDQFSKVARSQIFEISIFICICLNTVTLSLSWYNMNKEIIQVLEVLNYIFTGIYTIEMVIKIIAFGKGYFQDGWCIFDFLIVTSAWAGILLLQVFNIDIGSISTIIRSFRIARVLKLIKAAKNLQQIFNTFILAIPEMINVGALLILFLFLFSVLGVSLFAEVKLQETMTRHANFENFGRAILTLLRVATGESWVGIMQDAARQPDINFSCILDQTYESKQEVGVQGCGTSFATPYFIAFILMVSLVFLNLFIAIILEGFAASASEQKIRLGEECNDAFTRAWRKYDPFAIGTISTTELEPLILDLIVEELEIANKNENSRIKSAETSVYFGLRDFKALEFYTKWKRDMISEEERQDFFLNWEQNSGRQRYLERFMRSFISDLQIPLYFNLQKVQFHDTLNGIIRVVYQTMHKKKVQKRDQTIATKKTVGEELRKLEKVEPGSAEFWLLSLREREEFLEETDQDFQKVVNRLENKGNDILKLSYMRRLRKATGKNLAGHLSIWEGLVYDSSHIMGAKIISMFLNQRYERKQERLRNERRRREKKADKERSQTYNTVQVRTTSGDLRRRQDDGRSEEGKDGGHVYTQSLQSFVQNPEKEEQEEPGVTDVSGLRDNTLLPLIDQTQMADQSGEQRLHSSPNIPVPVTTENWINKIEAEVNDLTSRPIEMPKPGGDDDLVNKDPTQNIQLNARSEEHEKSAEQVAQPPAEVNADLRKSQDKPLPREASKDFIEQLKEVQQQVAPETSIAMSQDFSTLIKGSNPAFTVPVVAAMTVPHPVEKKSPVVRAEISISSERDSREYRMPRGGQELSMDYVQARVVGKTPAQHSLGHRTGSLLAQGRAGAPSQHHQTISAASGLSSTKPVQRSITQTQGNSDRREGIPSKYIKAEFKHAQNQSSIMLSKQESSALKESSIMQEDLLNSLRPQVTNGRANLNVTQNGSTINNQLSNHLDAPAQTVKVNNRRTQSYERVNKSYQDRGSIGQLAQLPPTMHAFQDKSSNGGPQSRDQTPESANKKLAIKSGEQMMKALQRTTVQQSGHDIITSSSKTSSKMQPFPQPPKEPLAIATPDLTRLEQQRPPMSSVQQLTSDHMLGNEGPGSRPAHSGSQPTMLIAQQAATIQPGVQIGSLLASTKRSREENSQVVQNFVGRSLYHKSVQSRDRQHGSQEAIVSRKLRKDSKSTTKQSVGPKRHKASNAGLVGDAQSREESARTIPKVQSGRQKQQMTVFQNSHKRPSRGVPAPKTDMLWFSGSRDDGEDDVSHNRTYEASPQKVASHTGGQRTLEGFNKLMQTAVPPANLPSNRLNITQQRSGSKEAGRATFTQQRQTVGPGAERAAFEFKSPKKKEMTHRETMKDSASPPRHPNPKAPYARAPTQPDKQPTVSHLLDSNGKLDATALAQLEPNGHALQPQPFMAGIAALNEPMPSPGTSQARTSSNLKKQLINQLGKVKIDRATASYPASHGANTSQTSNGNYSSQRPYRSGSRGAQRAAMKKKKELFDAYNLI